MSLPLYNQHRKVLHHGKNILLRGDVHYDEEQQPFDDAKGMGRRNRFRPKGFFKAKRRGGGGGAGAIRPPVSVRFRSRTCTSVTGRTYPSLRVLQE